MALPVQRALVRATTDVEGPLGKSVLDWIANYIKDGYAQLADDTDRPGEHGEWLAALVKRFGPDVVGEWRYGPPRGWSLQEWRVRQSRPSRRRRSARR